MTDDRTLQASRRLFLEQYGDPMVTNTYLKIALTLVSLIAVGLLVLDWKTIRTFENFRPLVIRIDDLGRAEAINYHNLEYKPQDAEAKYFLSQFCTLYYRRNRYTIQNDFSKSLYFLDGKLADGILDAYRKDDIIKKFITNTSAPEIDVDVKKVALEEMETPPVFSQYAYCPHTSQPTRSIVLADTPGALLEDLRCFTASGPLLDEFQGKHLSGLPLKSWRRK